MQELIERFVLENPTGVLVALFVVAISATFLYRARKQKGALIVAAAGAVAMAAVVLAASLIDTDRERIEKMLDDLRGAVASGNATAFSRHVHPEFTDGGGIDARAFKASVSKALQSLAVGRIQHKADPPRFTGDRAEVEVVLTADVERPALFPGHRSTWLLRLRRHADAPRGWAITDIRVRQFEQFVLADLSLATVLSLIP